MKFYLNEKGLRMVSADGLKRAILMEDGTWLDYSGYDLWPPRQGESRSPAKIEAQFTGLKEEAAVWFHPTVEPYEAPEEYMARRAGRNL